MMAINNETIESLINDMREQLAHNVTIETHIISDFDDFESEVEDNPKVCK